MLITQMNKSILLTVIKYSNIIEDATDVESSQQRMIEHNSREE